MALQQTASHNVSLETALEQWALRVILFGGFRRQTTGNHTLIRNWRHKWRIKDLSRRWSRGLWQYRMSPGYLQSIRNLSTKWCNGVFAQLVLKNVNFSLSWLINNFSQPWCFRCQCLDPISGSRRGSTWPRGYTPCWQVYTNRARVMSFIPTKSVACMSTSWLLGNVYMAKSCKGKKRDPLKLGLVS
jgi:hypothetical protein